MRDHARTFVLSPPQRALVNESAGFALVVSVYDNESNLTTACSIDVRFANSEELASIDAAVPSFIG